MITAEPTNAGMEVLVPLLKDYLEKADKDRDATKEIISDLKSAIKALENCAVAQKIQMKEIQTLFKGFSGEFKRRDVVCSARFELIEAQLRALPNEKEMEKMMGKLDDIPSAKNFKDQGDKIDTLSKDLNTLVTRVAIICGIAGGLFVIVQWVWPIIWPLIKI